jgi:undecaprenyl-diphosphatase
MMLTFDFDIFQLLNGLAKQSGLFDVVAIFFASPAIYILGIGAMVAMLYGATRKTQYYRLAVAALALIFSRGLVVPVIRFLYDRPRPFEALPDIITLVTKVVGEPSFPSGHATIAFAFAGALYYMKLQDRAWWKYAVVIAVLIAIARVVAGVHYPSDSIAGALIGWGSVWVTKRYLLSVPI